MAASAADPFATGYDEISKIIFSLVYFLQSNQGYQSRPILAFPAPDKFRHRLLLLLLVPVLVVLLLLRPFLTFPAPTPTPTPTQIDLQDKDNLQRLSVADY